MTSSKKQSTSRDILVENYVTKIGKSGVTQKYLGKLKAALSIVEEAYNTLHAHRSLCEDYDQFKNLEIEKRTEQVQTGIGNGKHETRIRDGARQSHESQTRI